MKQSGKKPNGDIAVESGGYMAREKAFIAKLKETNGAPLFDSKDEGLDFLAETLSKFPNYVNTVVAYQVTMPIVYERYEGQELRDRVMGLDGTRRSAHEAAIDSLNILNRLYGRMGLAPFAEVDTADRHAVADFCGKYVNEVYNGAINGTMDSVTYGKRTTYDTDLRDRLAEAEAVLDTTGRQGATEQLGS